MYLCKANSTIYFLNQNEKEKWVNPLNIGNSQKLYPIDDYQNDLMAVPLYKTNYCLGVKKNSLPTTEGAFMFLFPYQKKK